MILLKGGSSFVIRRYIIVKHERGGGLVNVIVLSQNL